MPRQHKRVKSQKLFVDSRQLVGPLHKCSTISVMWLLGYIFFFSAFLLSSLLEFKFPRENLCDLANFAELFLPSNGQWVDKLFVGVEENKHGLWWRTLFPWGTSFTRLCECVAGSIVTNMKIAVRILAVNAQRNQRREYLTMELLSLVKFHGKEGFELCPEWWARIEW